MSYAAECLAKKEKCILYELLLVYLLQEKKQHLS